jgi:hypothetical protein
MRQYSSPLTFSRSPSEKRRTNPSSEGGSVFASASSAVAVVRAEQDQAGVLVVDHDPVLRVDRLGQVRRLLVQARQVVPGDPRRGPLRLVGAEAAFGGGAPRALVVEQDDEAAVELLKRLERQVRDGVQPLSHIEELGERRSYNTPLVGVEDDAAGEHGDVVPLPVVDAALAVAVQAQPVLAHVFGHQPLGLGRLQAVPELVEV